MTTNAASKIIQAYNGNKTDGTPLWLMRQAGRYLPEYRALRAEAGSFLAMCYNPELAAEVTLQPMKRFDIDAAIIFSDILVIPHAMGQHVYFVEGEGPKLDPIDFKSLRDADDADFAKLLAPVYEAIRLTRARLPADKALIGFVGGPFTLASYMIEGGGGHDFTRTKAMMREDKAGFSALISRLTNAVSVHLLAQIEAGCDAVQVFESHAGQLQGAEFVEFVVHPVRAIAKAIGKRVPVVGFARGATQDDLLRFAVDTGIDAVGIDQHTDMGWAARNIPPRLCLQGNLNPETLLSGVGLENAITNILKATQGRAFVFNLGHGVIKETPPEHVALVVQTVHNFKQP